MAETTIQPIQGANLLDSLVNFFFKGLDKALADKADYEEEMGVLKQINRIPIETLDGKNKYVLTIKLSPVRGKDSYYYVEAETDAPGLNVSAINHKTLQLNKDNMAQFRATVDKLLARSRFVADMDRSDNSVPEGKVVGEPGDEEDQTTSNDGQKGSQNDISAEGEVAEYLRKADIWFNQEHIAVANGADGKLYQLTFKFTTDDIKDKCYIAIDVTPVGDTNVIETLKTEISLLDTDANLIDESTFFKAVRQGIQNAASDASYSSVNFGVPNQGGVVSATFIKDKEGVGLTAIKASSDLNRTMEIIYDIMDSDDFVEQLPEGEEMSFAITEQDDDYEIEEIDGIDTSCAVCDIYKAISSMYITLKLLQAMIGVKIWRNDNFLNDSYLKVAALQTQVATWLVDSEDPLQILSDPYSLVPSFEKYRNYASNEDIPQVKEDLCHDLEALADVLDILSVDLCEDCQDEIASFISQIECLCNSRNSNC